MRDGLLAIGGVNLQHGGMLLVNDFLLQAVKGKRRLALLVSGLHLPHLDNLHYLISVQTKVGFTKQIKN